MTMIHKKIIAVMADIDSISKGRDNKQQGYKFRGIDDVYNALHKVFATHGVFTVPTVLDEKTEIKTTKSGTELIYRILKIKFTFFAEDGSSFDAIVIGEGMDSGDKASNKAMAVAHKYALLQVFAIPTEEPKDPENDSHELVRKSLTYEGTDHDKQRLGDMMFNAGIKEKEDMRTVAGKCIGKTWAVCDMIIAEEAALTKDFK